MPTLKIRVLVSVEILDFAGKLNSTEARVIMLPKGRYILKQIKNPFGLKGDWFVLNKNVTQGLSYRSWLDKSNFARATDDPEIKVLFVKERY